MITIKGAQRADCLINSRAFEIAFGLEVEEEIKDLSTSEGRDVVIRKVSRDLVNPAKVGLGRARAQAFELDETGKLLIPLRGRNALR